MVVIGAFQKALARWEPFERNRSEGKGPCALTHIVSSGMWLGAWCPFLSCCSVVVAVVAPAALAALAVAAVAAAVAAGPAGAVGRGAVAEAVVNG